MKPLSAYQSAALMLCFSLGRLTAFRPEGDSLLVCAAAEAVCGIVIAAVLALLPEGSSVGSRNLRRASALLVSLWLVVTLALMLTDLADSLSYSFPDFYASPAVITVGAAAAAYCASMGLRGCGRAACAVTAVTLAVLLLTVLGAADGFDPVRLELAVDDPGDMFGRQLMRSLSRAAELPAAVMLRGRTDRPRMSGLIRFLGSSLAWGGMLTVCAGVLGDRALTGIPTDTLSSCSKTAVIERFDALMLLAWTLCVLMSAAAVMLALAECAGQFSEKAARYAPGASAVICGAAACLLTGKGAGIPAAPAVILSAAAVMLGTVFVCGRKGDAA